MGFIHVDVGLSNPAHPDAVEEIRVLVDTGATLSVVPASLLDRLGVRRSGRQRFRGFGGVITRETGTVDFHYDRETGGARAVFGNEDDPVVLGVTALEVLGYQVNPVDGELHRVDMLI